MRSTAIVHPVQQSSMTTFLGGPPRGGFVMTNTWQPRRTQVGVHWL